MRIDCRCESLVARKRLRVGRLGLGDGDGVEQDQVEGIDHLPLVFFHGERQQQTGPSSIVDTVSSEDHKLEHSRITIGADDEYLRLCN